MGADRSDDALAVSAIAWNHEDEADAFSLLAKAGVSCVELVPFRAERDPAGFAKKLAEAGLRAVAFQALLYGTDGLQLFRGAAEREALYQRLASLVPLAGTLGVRALVFGSPGNRWIDEALLGRREAYDIARAFFVRLGNVAADAGVRFCIEPNPRFYNCNFLNTTEETAQFVKEVGSPGVAINLDLGAMVMNDEDIGTAVAKNVHIAGHVHASYPRLAPLLPSEFQDARHSLSRLLEALRKNNYTGAISIEMRTRSDWRSETLEAIRFFRESYDGD